MLITLIVVVLALAASQMAMPAMFHPSMPTEVKRDPNERVFRGGGTPYLAVPGLTKVLAVVIDGIELALDRIDRYLTDASGKNSVDAKVPLVMLEQTERGPVLMRSRLSNDGIWQDGSNIIVRGEWSDLPEGESVHRMAVATQKRLDRMNTEELVAFAVSLGAAVSPDGDKAEALRAIARMHGVEFDDTTTNAHLIDSLMNVGVGV